MEQRWWNSRTSDGGAEEKSGLNRRTSNGGTVEPWNSDGGAV